MTQTPALPQSQLGGIVTKPLADGFARIDVANDEALKVLDLSPVDTVWGRPSGRPIYDRLPGVSQGYKEEYFGEVGRGLVYIEPQFGSSVGLGSLQVGALQNDPRVLVVNNGIITWAYGQISTDTLAINLETIIEGGIQDGGYQVGYYLNRVSPDIPTYSKYQVQDYSLGSSKTIYNTDAEAKYHPVLNMFSEQDDGSWRPTEFGATGDYPNGKSVTMDFTEPVVAAEFNLIGSSPTLATAKCALYSSNDAVVWDLQDSVNPTKGIWTLRSSADDPNRYFRLFFWNGETDIREVRYSGEAFFRNQRPTGPTSAAEIFLEGEYDEIDRPHITLAYLTVRNFEITEVRDVRSQTSRKYEPVASWLTDFQDFSLRSVITSIESYSSLYMSPTTGADILYERLLEESFVFDSETKTPVIYFPSGVELAPGYTVIGEAAIGTDPLNEDIASNPQGFVIIGQEVPFYRSDSVVSPQEVIFVRDPSDAGDMATKNYVDFALIPSLDNGKY